MMKQNGKKILTQASNARADVGRVFDDMCPTDIFLLTFTYHLLATVENGEYIPKVALEFLNPVYYSKVNHGPDNCTTFVGDQIQWKPKCSKCGKVMYHGYHDLYTCVIMIPLIVLIHNGLIDNSPHDLWKAMTSYWYSY